MIVPHTRAWATTWKTRTLTTCQRDRLQGMLLTANEDIIMQTQKQSAVDSPFSACREYIE